MDLYNCSRFQEHLRMLSQSLSALCLAPGGPGSRRKYLEAQVKSTGVTGRFARTFQTKYHFADVQIRRSRWLLGAIPAGITKGKRNPTMWNVRAGAVAVVTAEEYHREVTEMTASGSARHEGRAWSTGLGSIVMYWLIQTSKDPTHLYFAQVHLHSNQANENRNRNS